MNTALVNYTRLCAAQKDSVAAIWNHPVLTPQEAAAALGQDAVKMFAIHGIITQAIAQIAVVDGVPPDIVMPGSAWVENPDGTITLTSAP